jgi:hypothetical protein
MVFDLTAKFIFDWTPWNSKCGLSARCFIGAILKSRHSFIHSFIYMVKHCNQPLAKMVKVTRTRPLNSKFKLAISKSISVCTLRLCYTKYLQHYWHRRSFKITRTRIQLFNLGWWREGVDTTVYGPKAKGRCLSGGVHQSVVKMIEGILFYNKGKRQRFIHWMKTLLPGIITQKTLRF